ncbi:MAG: UPF0256 protein [Acidimicrobiia bacterium]|nr:MAG: UPF0256 protein [Acidimicrobiia bacterium]
MVPLEIRPVGAAEVDDFRRADLRGFGVAPAAPGGPRTWTEAELDRTRAAIEDGEIVGTSRAYSFELTLPGGGVVPAAAVSWVAVIPTHRRRGVLTRMIEALHADARAREEPVAVLTASEGAIYGRFGYGVAAWRLGVEADRARVRFRDEVRAGRLRMIDAAEAAEVLPAVYDRLRRARAGAVSRPATWWPEEYFARVRTDQAVFFVVHEDTSGAADGFVAYEITGGWDGGLPDRRLRVFDLQAAAPGVRAALWRYVFGVDLVASVAGDDLPVDEPLRHLVTDPRRVRVRYVNDGLWLAPLDPRALLAARRYAPRADRLVVEVHQPDGARARLAVEGEDRDAACVPTTEEADLSCSAAALGAVALGGNRWSELAQAGTVAARDGRTLARADAMFASSPAAASTSWF